MSAILNESENNVSNFEPDTFCHGESEKIVKYPSIDFNGHETQSLFAGFDFVCGRNLFKQRICEGLVFIVA
jgi:hypothetical protein